MAKPKKVYWDSCVWLRLINGEDGHELCHSVLSAAQRGDVEIWTSSLTLAEVYKFKCESTKSLAVEQDKIFEDYISSDFVVEVQVDHEIAVMSRRLCRHHRELKKPTDGIHLASAIVNNLDEFHSFDHSDLLVLNGNVSRADGLKLHICKPYLMHVETTGLPDNGIDPKQLTFTLMQDLPSAPPDAV